MTGPGIVCTSCGGAGAFAADCVPCSGRGRVLTVPFCVRPWDHLGNGLWLGGHMTQFGSAPCLPGNRFDLVISLYYEPGMAPAPEVPHLVHRMPDAALDRNDARAVEALAARAFQALNDGGQVLIRCHAGLNRSALVAGLVHIHRGDTVDDFLTTARRARSPWVLFNESFEAYLRATESANGLTEQLPERSAGSPRTYEA